MANLEFFVGIGDYWPPDVLAGGTIQTRSATQMVYLSAEGFTITVTGTGFTYDDDGMGSTGTVTRVQVANGALALAEITGTSVELQRYCTFAFGYDRGPTRPARDPNPFDLYQSLMASSDNLFGSDEDDELIAGLGNDVIFGGLGFDYIVADAGNDRIDGGADRDWLTFEESYFDFSAYRGIVVNLATGTGTDCWGGSDTIIGIERIRDSVFSDHITGSAADEQFTLSRGNDTLIGGDGFDQVRYDMVERWGATRGVNVNLATGVVRDPWKGTDSLSGIEGVIGSDFADRITGSGANEYFVGGGGVDTISGGLGHDIVAFWPANDEPGGQGVVINLTMVGAVIQNDGLGNIENVTGIEEFDGTDFADNFTGDTNTNLFSGNGGNDTIRGGGGDDKLWGGEDRDSLNGGSGKDILDGGRQSDTLTGGTGADDFILWFGDKANMGVDRITDMQAEDDIVLALEGLGGLATGWLAAPNFLKGAGATAALTADHRVIYNTTNGALYFDEDGAGGTAAFQIATVSNLFNLTLTDIYIS